MMRDQVYLLPLWCIDIIEDFIIYKVNNKIITAEMCVWILAYRKKE